MGVDPRSQFSRIAPLSCYGPVIPGLLSSSRQTRDMNTGLRVALSFTLRCFGLLFDYLFIFYITDTVALALNGSISTSSVIVRTRIQCLKYEELSMESGTNSLCAKGLNAFIT
jgi:hypothetical protein